MARLLDGTVGPKWTGGEPAALVGCTFTFTPKDPQHGLPLSGTITSVQGPGLDALVLGMPALVLEVSSRRHNGVPVLILTATIPIRSNSVSWELRVEKTEHNTTVVPGTLTIHERRGS